MSNKNYTELAQSIIGKTLAETRELDIGSWYPIVDADRQVIVGVFSAEDGTPAGYELDQGLQAFVAIDAYSRE
jgi:hypothetical protein